MLKNNFESCFKSSTSSFELFFYVSVHCDPSQYLVECASPDATSVSVPVEYAPTTVFVCRSKREVPVSFEVLYVVIVLAVVEPVVDTVVS